MVCKAVTLAVVKAAICAVLSEAICTEFKAPNVVDCSALSCAALSTGKSDVESPAACVLVIAAICAVVKYCACVVVIADS